MSQTQKCSLGPMLTCHEICGKILNCEIHTCEKKCHHGFCDPCENVVTQGILQFSII